MDHPFGPKSPLFWTLKDPPIPIPIGTGQAFCFTQGEGFFESYIIPRHEGSFYSNIKGSFAFPEILRDKLFLRLKMTKEVISIL